MYTSNAWSHLQAFLIPTFALLLTSLGMVPLAHGQDLEAETTSSANVRSGPSTNHTILGSVPEGTILPVIDQQDRWYVVDVSELDFAERAGFIHGSLLNIREIDELQPELQNGERPDIAAPQRPERPGRITQDDLTDMQIQTFNRSRLSVEITIQGQTITRGSRSQHAAARTWTAYQGFDVPLTEEEFFRIAGYEAEAEQVRAWRRNGQMMGLYSAGFLVAGAFMLSKSFTTEVVGGGSGFTVEEQRIRYGWLIPAGLTIAIGSGMAREFFTRPNRTWAPYSTVENIADDYNRNLLNDIYYGQYDD